ncbi:hypothetical protein [Thermaurantiacus sp.]
MAEVEWWDHEDAGAMAHEIAGDLAFIVAQAIEASGKALVALPVAPALAAPLAALAAEELPWHQVTLIPTDDDARGTKASALKALFADLGAKVVPLGEAESLPFPPDMVWLALKPDGQVAGLAPGPGLVAALTTPRPIVDVPDGQGLGLSGAAIRAARAIVLTLSGAEERTRVEQAIADGPGSRRPIGRLLAECDQAIDIHVVADEGETDDRD